MTRSRERSAQAIEFTQTQRHEANEFAWTVWQWVDGNAWRLVSLLVSVGLCLTGCNSKSTTKSTDPPVVGSAESRPTEPQPEVTAVTLEKQPFVMPRVHNPGYVGPQACAECHQPRLQECLGSSHFRTCRVPEPATMPRGFESNPATFELPNTDVRFEMSRRGERYFQTAINKSAPNVMRTESSIDLILGAGKSSDEVYLSWHADNTLWELPIAWVYANDCWGASGFDRHAGGDHARALTLRCFECHNTWFEHVPGTLAEYRREELILGVTCERCHGPAKEHVDYHRRHPQETQSHGILLPSSLPRERLIEVCTQCHGNAIRHRGPALSFRPGQSLDDHYRWVTPDYPEDDHVANQIGTMRDSKCFQQSSMTCITCHDPHLTDRPVTGADFQSNCTSCHQPHECGKQLELPEPIRGQCTDCHMRKYVKINVNFDLADDSYVPPTRRSQHRIAIDNTATDETLLKWHRSQNSPTSLQAAGELEFGLLQHWLAEAERCADEGRYRGAIAAVREALLVQPSDNVSRAKLKHYVAIQSELDLLQSQAEFAARNNQTAEAIALLQRILELQPANALVTGKLGTLVAKQGDAAAAKAMLAKVLELDPDEQYGVSMLAWFAMLDKDYVSAAKLYEQADSIEPYNAKIHYLWAEALGRLGRFQEAVAHYQQSLRIDPAQVEALRGATAAAAQSGDFTAALTFAQQAVQLTEYRDVSDLMALAQVQLQLSKMDDVTAVLAHALTLAVGNPSLESNLRRWASDNKVPL